MAAAMTHGTVRAYCIQGTVRLTCDMARTTALGLARGTVRETGRRIAPSHVASIRGVRHRLNEFLPRSFDAACPSDRWHDTADFKRAKNRDDHPCIACSLLRNGRAAW